LFKVVEKTIGKTLQELCIDKDFLNSTPTTQKIQTRIDTLDCIKLQSVCTAKAIIKSEEMVYRMKEIFASYSANSVLIFKVCKEIKKIILQKSR
jgi:hypothetical protein